MKANVNGVEVEGTPEEIATFIRVMNVLAGTVIPYGGGKKELQEFVKSSCYWNDRLLGQIQKENPDIKFYNEQGFEINVGGGTDDAQRPDNRST